MWIYVSGPYSSGDTAVHVANAVRAGMRLRELGHVPIIPHLSHFAHLIESRPYQFWMDWDLELLKRCDAVLRLPGDSPGAEIEVRAAQRAGLPVYHSVEEVNTER